MNKEQEKQARKLRKKSEVAATKSTAGVEKLLLLVTVVGRNKGEYYADLLQSFEVNMQLSVPAQGTASPNMLGLLGLSDTDKTVLFGVIREGKVKAALSTLDEKFRSIKGGKGIAFTVQLSSLIGTLLYGFLSNNRQVERKA